MRFPYFEFLFHIFDYCWSKENRLLYWGLCCIEVCYIKVPLYWVQLQPKKYLIFDWMGQIKIPSLARCSLYVEVCFQSAEFITLRLWHRNRARRWNENHDPWAVYQLLITKLKTWQIKTKSRIIAFHRQGILHNFFAELKKNCTLHFYVMKQTQSLTQTSDAFQIFDSFLMLFVNRNNTCTCMVHVNV